MTRMTGPDCVVMCNLINTYIHTYIHTYINTYIHTYIHTYIPHRNGQFTTCMDFDLLYSLPSVLSTCGWTVPYLASNVGGGDCGAVVVI